MSEELKPLYADVHDIDKLVQQMSDSSANVVYNLHEDILCLREQLAKERRIRESYALVPVVPTEEMIAAAHHEVDQAAIHNYGGPADPMDIWQAMIAAAQES